MEYDGSRGSSPSPGTEMKLFAPNSSSSPSNNQVRGLLTLASTSPLLAANPKLSTSRVVSAASPGSPDRQHCSSTTQPTSEGIHLLSAVSYDNC